MTLQNSPGSWTHEPANRQARMHSNGDCLPRGGAWRIVAVCRVGRDWHAMRRQAGCVSFRQPDREDFSMHRCENPVPFDLTMERDRSVEGTSELRDASIVSSSRLVLGGARAT